MKIIIRRWLPALIMMVTTLWACSYFPEDEVGGGDEETQISTATFYDVTADFTQYLTFAIADSIAYLQLDDDGQPAVVYHRELSRENEVIVQSVTEKLRSYCGLTQITQNQLTRPDLVVDLLFMNIDDVERYYSNWWYYYFYWYDRDWHFLYHPYYPMEIPRYSKGTLIIDIKDLKNADFSTHRLTPATAVWVGAIQGLYEGTYNDTQLNNAIKDCFTQTSAFRK